MKNLYPRCFLLTELNVFPSIVLLKNAKTGDDGGVQWSVPAFPSVVVKKYVQNSYAVEMLANGARLLEE